MNAPLKLRFAALFIDFCLIIAYALVLLVVTLGFYHFALGSIPAINSIGTTNGHIVGFLALTLPVGLYFFLTESSKHHATLGKRLVKIKVSSQNKGLPTKKQVAIRTIVKLLPWEFAHTFVYQVIYYSNSTETPPWVLVGLCLANLIPIIYVLVVMIRKDHAGPHDLAAGTLVKLRS